jgi:hypothetical protein
MADRQNNVKALISLTIFKNDKDLGSFPAAFFFAKFLATWGIVWEKILKKKMSFGEIFVRFSSSSQFLIFFSLILTYSHRYFDYIGVMWMLFVRVDFWSVEQCMCGDQNTSQRSS